MSPSIPLPPAESEVARVASTEIAPLPQWRVVVLRSIAAAHFVAGIVEFLKVVVNLVLKLPYTAGPFALPGVVSVILARVVYALSQGLSYDAEELQLRTRWIQHQFLVARGWPGSAIVAALLLVAPAPILAFLISPRTDVLFANRDDGRPSRRKRHWWTLSLQCVIGALVVELALVLLALFSVGPMPEVVWIAAGLTLDRP
jgi:hypothetical protein